VLNLIPHALASRLPLKFSQTDDQFWGNSSAPKYTEPSASTILLIAVEMHQKLEI